MFYTELLGFFIHLNLEKKVYRLLKNVKQQYLRFLLYNFFYPLCSYPCTIEACFFLQSKNGNCELHFTVVTLFLSIVLYLLTVMYISKIDLSHNDYISRWFLPIGILYLKTLSMTV